jgi:hypothetical protein
LILLNLAIYKGVYGLVGDLIRVLVLLFIYYLNILSLFGDINWDLYRGDFLFDNILVSKDNKDVSDLKLGIFISEAKG